jgi:glycosyltransferase involved in cell wall biosynthesis
MKIAVIDHIGNFGGASRVVRALLPALKRSRKDSSIVYYGNPFSIRREGLASELADSSIEIRKLKSLFAETIANVFLSKLIPDVNVSSAIRMMQYQLGGSTRFLPSVLAGAVHKEVETISRNYDLLFFPWPFFMKCPITPCPIVGIFHDLNFKYFFGSPVMSSRQIGRLNTEFDLWLKRAVPVVSSNFMADELRKFYPSCSHGVKVVHLAPPNAVSSLTPDAARAIVKRMGIEGPYILYPTNNSVHKNLGTLIASIELLHTMGHRVTLILTGHGTEMATGKATFLGVQRETENPNVIGLGYVSNARVDALLQCAQAVVTASLYEAGNGPGLEAWAKGIPVAMSNIPAYVEHMKVQGVRAELFDPRSPSDIADKISNILLNPQRARADALLSQKALEGLTWSNVAEKYHSIFEEAVSYGKRL